MMTSYGTSGGQRRGYMIAVFGVGCQLHTPHRETETYYWLRNDGLTYLLCSYGNRRRALHYHV